MTKSPSHWLTTLSTTSSKNAGTTNGSWRIFSSISGLCRDQVLSRLPSPTIAALVGSQYYWVRHVHPVGLLGYIAMFEGYPPSRLDIDRVQEITGYGSGAFRP